MRTWLVLVVVSLFFWLAAPAHAQDTGGSFGGGDWGGGGGGDYSGGGSYSGGDSYSYSGGGGDDYSYSGGGGGGGGGGKMSGGAFFAMFLLACLFFGIFWVKDQLKGRRIGTYTSAPYIPMSTMGQVDVTVLRFGLDARVRPFVQKELDRIAKTSDTKTKEGLVKSLNEVALMLRRLRDAWVYGGAHNEAMRAMGAAHGVFQKHVNDARALFRHELVRAHDGQVTTAESPERVQRTDEGPGLVLVSVIVAARQELFTVQRIGNGDDLRRALEVLSAMTAQILVAMEVVWTPADPDDRMSSVELEAILPDQVFPIAGAMVGKVVCTYCNGPFPQELITCPHCGAPARSAS